MFTFDFETEAIDGNPIYNPPKPVGVAIKRDDEPSTYLAWGHPTNNNTTWEAARNIFMTALRSDPQWLAHHSAFEDAILKKYFKVYKADYTRFHDTQFLLFLDNPYAYSFSLKPSAERVLGMKPEEQDRLRDWIVSNVPGATTKNFGAFISKAPGDLVGEYACGDTDRTRGLHNRLMPEVEAADMMEPYMRELKLMPILSKSSAHGIRVDTKTLSRDVAIYREVQALVDQLIFKKLGREFELSKDAQLADALDAAGMMTQWVMTPTGKRSVARKNLMGNIKDPEVLELLAYRGIVETCMGTFGEPWLEQAEKEGGRLHAQWNQVRGNRGEGGDLSGTRTGRMSCQEPNLTNIPNDFEDVKIPAIVKHFFEMLAGKEIIMPMIPHMRRYLLPEEGHIWLKRDFSAQEMRIMAHFAEGRLFEAFHRDPATDPHVEVQRMIKEYAGLDLKRKPVKVIGFGIMYGRGTKALGEALGVPYEESVNLRNAYFMALPEVRELADVTRRRGRSGQAIRTWGKRRYYREPNPDRDLSYKLLNYLIQGSAADQTKESTIEWDEHCGDALLMADVHDEMNISAPEESAPEHMDWLRAAMDKDRFDVPFRSEGYKGPNWADITKLENEYV